MSWTKARRLEGGGLGVPACLLVCLLAYSLAALACPREAWSLGPFSHLALARQLEPGLGLDLDGDPLARQALYVGALAPDAGYYPGAESALAELAHHLRPWDLCRALLEMARTPRERAFALGWLSHALVDWQAHQTLVNPLAGSTFSVDPLNHKRVEWGLDCWLLSQPHQAWLWEIELASPEGLDLWARALGQVHHVKVDVSLLEQALAAEMAEVRRLPRIFWGFGLLQRPGYFWTNRAGAFAGISLRPALVWLLGLGGGLVNERAVLDARRPTPGDIQALLACLERVGRDMPALLAGGTWPQGNLDADPLCQEPACASLRIARHWMEGRR